mgnify:CR=1 FL=1
MARIFAAYVRGVPFIKEQVDAVLGILGAKPGDLAAFQSTLGRTAIRQIETIYIANLMVEWVNELAEAIKGGDSEYFRELPASPARARASGRPPAARSTTPRRWSTARSRATRSSSVHVEPGSHQRRRRARPARAGAHRRSGGRHPRSPSTPCARFTPSTPAPLAPCMSRSAVPASTSRPSPAWGWSKMPSRSLQRGPSSYLRGDPLDQPDRHDHAHPVGHHHPLPGAAVPHGHRPRLPSVLRFRAVHQLRGPRHHGLLREDRADRRHAPAGDRLQDLACPRRTTVIRPWSGSSTTCS